MKRKVGKEGGEFRVRQEVEETGSGIVLQSRRFPSNGGGGLIFLKGWKRNNAEKTGGPRKNLWRGRGGRPGSTFGKGLLVPRWQQKGSERKGVFMRARLCQNREKMGKKIEGGEENPSTKKKKHEGELRTYQRKNPGLRGIRSGGG